MACDHSKLQNPKTLLSGFPGRWQQPRLSISFICNVAPRLVVSTLHSLILLCIKMKGHFTLMLEGPYYQKLKSLIVGKCWQCLTSLHTRGWGPKGPRKFEWDKKSTCCLTWHKMDNASWFIMCGRIPLKRMIMKYHLRQSLIMLVFSLHWKACDHTNINIPWYRLQMTSKGPQNFMVTALGQGVKWP